MNVVKELEPKEKVALGASLFLFLGALLAVEMLWDSFSEKEERHAAPIPAAVETNSADEVHKALDGALESISNRLFRATRPSDLR